MWLGRKLIAWTLLVLFSHGGMADAAPLVWCIAPGGHNAVEISVGSGGHRGTVTLDAAKTQAGAKCDQLGAKHGSCTDWKLTQAGQSPLKPSLVTPFSPTFEPPLWVGEWQTIAERPEIAVDVISNQLAQLRTVVLRV